jgi:HAD superfamily hydrolase (TIGR01450 family)
MVSGWCGAVAEGLGGVNLERARGFVFDVDGTLVHRGADRRARAQPGAVEVLDRIRASGRPLVLFTNGSHVPSAAIARGLRDDGLPIADAEMLTPTDSAISYLRATHRDDRVFLFGSPAVAQRMRRSGIALTDGEDAEAVYVAHLEHIDAAALERAARAVMAGAPLLTASYARGYAGANGIIFSRGAMITAAIAKVTGARPRVLGKPSRAAVAAIATRLALPSPQLVVIGDDVGMDIALGRLGGCATILVRSGISGQIDLDRVPIRHRPDAVIDRVADLLDHL